MTGRKQIVDFTGPIIISVFALVFSFKAGERGFFPLDQSIVFDGAYRIIQGQIPYRDFLMPFGPVVFWMQAAFFKIFGINYFSYLLLSAVMNAIGTLCSIIIIRKIFPERMLLSYIAGILTGVWFYPPFGTPWLEQTSFFFSFLGLVSILGAIVKSENRNKNLLCILAGSFAAFSLLSKQNAGLFILPVYLILIYAGKPAGNSTGRRLILFLVGCITILLIFFIWLILRSNLDNFIQYFFEIPSALGLQRLFHNPSPILADFLIGRGLRSSRFVILAFLIIVFYFLIKELIYIKFQKNNRNLLLAGILYVYLTFFQNLFNHTTCNQDVNGFPFIGIMLAIGTGFLVEIIKSKHPCIRFIFFTAVVFALCYVGYRGVEVALDRRVQDIFSGSKFPSYCTAERLKGLRWGKPTTIEMTDITEQSINDLIAFIERQKENFFIFPDFTIFYGVIGTPSPQPLLWFQKEWTYPKYYCAVLDEWIINSLVKNNVGIIIIEEKSFLGTEKRLGDFPALRKYINDNFTFYKKIGIFNIHLRN